MNNTDAKLLLQAYRPNGQDSQDSFFAEALAQTAKDPRLSAWFDSEQAFDQAITSKLKNFVIPQDLKSSILLGEKMAHRRRKIQNPFFLALAACILMGIFSFVYFQSSSGVSFDRYEKDVAQFTATHQFNPIFKANDLPQIRSWLEKNRGSSGFNLTSHLDQLNRIGCQVHNIHGQKVSVICFWVDQNKREAIHLFVVDRAAIKNSPTATIFRQRGQVITASWGDARHAYVLTGIGDEEYLKKFL